MRGIPFKISQIIKKIRIKTEYIEFKQGKASDDIKGRIKIRISRTTNIML